MSKSNKIAPWLVLLAALATAFFAYSATGKLKQQSQELSDAESLITKQRAQVSSLNTRLGELEGEVARHQENERNLQVALQQKELTIGDLMDQLAEQKKLAQSAFANEGDLAVEVEQLRRAQGDLEVKLTEVQEARDGLQYMLEHGGVAPDDGWKPVEVPTGEVVAAYAPSYLTLDFGASASGGATPELYIQRAGKIVGKVSARRIHYTTLVTEVDHLVDEIKGGDAVRIEDNGDALPFFDDIKGTVSAVHGMGFFSVDLGASDVPFTPQIKVLRDGLPVGDFNIDKVHLVTLVLEMDTSAGAVDLRKGDTVTVAN